MQRSTLPTRRATRRPAKPSNHRPLATTSLSVALGVAVAIPGVAVAQASTVDGGNPAIDVSSLADQARDALTANAPIAVSAQSEWSAPNVEVEVKKIDARALRRAKAEEEAAKRRELAQQRAAERAERRASRAAAREAIAQKEAAEAPAAPVGGDTSSVISVAKKYLGVPYVWGGSTPRGFDCSGFTRYVYKQVGINLPHQSTAQMRRGQRISAAEAKPGDLIWHPGHVGIYLGNGKMIHAPSPGKRVQVAPIKFMRGHSFYRMG